MLHLISDGRGGRANLCGYQLLDCVRSLCEEGVKIIERLAFVSKVSISGCRQSSSGESVLARLNVNGVLS